MRYIRTPGLSCLAFSFSPIQGRPHSRWMKKKNKCPSGEVSFHWFLKFCRVSDDQTVAGSLFHVASSATANARSPILLEILVRGNGTDSRRLPVGAQGICWHFRTATLLYSLRPCRVLTPKLIKGGNYDRLNAVNARVIGHEPAEVQVYN